MAKPAKINLPPDWPAVHQERRKLSALKPHPRNPKVHPETQIDSLSGSIEEFGVTRAIVVDENDQILAGHGQRLAGMKRGIEEMPVFVARGWSEDKKLAFMIADNRLSEIAGYDDSMLRENIAALQLAGFNMNTLGFDPPSLQQILGLKTGLTDPEAVPPVPERPVSRLGDAWVMGRHRLACGDATKAADVARALGDCKPNLMVTDPPYGVNYDPAWRVSAKHADGSPLSTGKVSMGAVNNDDRADWREAWALFPGNVAYVWHGGLHAALVAESLMACDFLIRSQIIWVKQQIVIGRGDYHWMHEPCWYAVRKGKPGNYQGDRKQRTVWEIANHSRSNRDRDDGATPHSTQKPVECMRKPIENSSKHGEFVYEPFSGSGTTIIAAEMIERACLAVELNPAYVDMAVTRWQNFTGQKARLENDGGRDFVTVAASRLTEQTTKPNDRLSRRPRVRAQA